MKEVLIRAARTFLQAAVGFIAANVVVYLSGMDGSSRAVKSAVAALITAAIASGLAAVMNMPALRSAKKPDGEVTEATDNATEAVDNATETVGGEQVKRASDTADGEQSKKASDTVEEATEDEANNSPQTADGEQVKKTSVVAEEATEAEAKNLSLTADGEQSKRALPDNDETEEKNE